MKKKQVVISIVAVALAVIATVGILMKQQYDGMLAATSMGLHHGESFGKLVPQSQCLDGVRLQFTACRSTLCELQARGFISGCMASAERDEFCSAVPLLGDSGATSAWIAQTCAMSGASAASRCSKYSRAFITACTEQKTGVPVTSGETFGAAFEEGFKRGFDKAVNGRDP